MRIRFSLVLVAACASRRAPPEPPPQTVERPPSLYVTMQGHATRTLQARDALLRGDTDGARTHLAKVATGAAHPHLPADLAPFDRGLREAAAGAATAQRPAEVAMVLGHAVSWCGRCHTAGGVQLEPSGLPAPEGDALTTHMARWRWATDRMWEALVVSDDGVWRAGLAALAEDPEVVQQAATAAARADTAEALTELVVRMGNSGAAAETPDARGEIVGLAVGMCASCHATTGGGPAPR